MRAFEAYVKNIAPSRISGDAYTTSWSTLSKFMITLLKFTITYFVMASYRVHEIAPKDIFKYLKRSKLSPSKNNFWIKPWNEKESIKIISIENFISDIEIQFELNIQFFRLRKHVWSVQVDTESILTKKRQFYENSSLFMMVNRLDNWLFL